MIRAIGLACGLLALPPVAETTRLTIAQDRLLAGSPVRSCGPSVTDLFMAGAPVTGAARVGGSARPVARRISVDAPVAGDPFAAGHGVTVGAAVGGDPPVAGCGPPLGQVTGNRRAGGADAAASAAYGLALDPPAITVPETVAPLHRVRIEQREDESELVTGLIAAMVIAFHRGRCGAGEQPPSPIRAGRSGRAFR